MDYEGHSAEELLAWTDEELDALILNDETLVFRVGSAQILGRFGIDGQTLIIELVQIDGGGEGVLPGLAAVARKLAGKRGIKFIEWRVHALTCTRPNLKLRRVLERKGFEVRDITGIGEVYYRLQPVDQSGPDRNDKDS